MNRHFVPNLHDWSKRYVRQILGFFEWVVVVDAVDGSGVTQLPGARDTGGCSCCLVEEDDDVDVVDDFDSDFDSDPDSGSDSDSDSDSDSFSDSDYGTQN